MPLYVNSSWSTLSTNDIRKVSHERTMLRRCLATPSTRGLQVDCPLKMTTVLAQVLAVCNVQKVGRPQEQAPRAGCARRPCTSVCGAHPRAARRPAPQGRLPAGACSPCAAAAAARRSCCRSGSFARSRPGSFPCIPATFPARGPPLQHPRGGKLCGPRPHSEHRLGGQAASAHRPRWCCV